jgi:hypothetical protein
MPHKNREDRLAAQKRHYAENAEYYCARSRDRRIELQTWFAEYRATLKCTLCPESHPATIDFHHADPSEKDVNIANAIGNGWSKKRILREIAKCLPLCSNCHRKLHYRERETKQAPVPVPSRSGKSAGTGEPIIAWPVGTSFV